MDRLLVVSNMYPSPERPYFGIFVERHIRALSGLGVDVTPVISSDAGGSAAATARKYARLLMLARREAARTKPQAILAHFVFPTGAVALAAARVAGAPVAVVAHGGDVAPGKSPWIRRATASVLSRAALTVAVSDAIAQDARRAGADPSRIVIASMGYDEEVFVPHPREEARRRVGLPAGARIAVVVGNLIERKGIGVVLDAAAGVRDAVPDLRWVLVGGGDQRPWRARASDAIIFAGPAGPGEVPWWLAAADVAVVPSLREPYGVAAVEALACGIPVVASRTGGLTEIMSGGHGVLVQPGDPAALATAVRRVLEDGTLRERLAGGGPEAAKAHTATRQARILLDALQRVV